MGLIFKLRIRTMNIEIIIFDMIYDVPKMPQHRKLTNAKLGAEKVKWIYRDSAAFFLSMLLL